MNRQIFPVETEIEVAVRAARERIDNISKPMSQERYDRVGQVQEWFLSQPDSFERTLRAVELLDIVANEDEGYFQDALFCAYRDDDPQIQAIAKMLESGELSGQTTPDELARIIAAL